MVNDNRYCTTTRENNDAADRYRTFSWLFLFWKHSEQFYMAGYSLVDWICRGYRLILQIFLFISWGRWVFAGWYGWLGVSGGMVTGAFWNRNGLAGIGQVLGFCFPQMLVYSVAYFGLLLLLVAWQKLRKERRNAVVMHRNRNGKTLAVFVFLLLCNTGIYTMGIWLELVVNPWVATFSMQLPIK